MPILVEIDGMVQEKILNFVDVFLHNLSKEKGVVILFEIHLCLLLSLHWLKSGDRTYDGQQAISIAHKSSRI